MYYITECGLKCHCYVFGLKFDLFIFNRISFNCIQDTLSSRAVLGLPAAFRPSASCEQRYLAYNSFNYSILISSVFLHLGRD